MKVTSYKNLELFMIYKKIIPGNVDPSLFENASLEQKTHNKKSIKRSEVSVVSMDNAIRIIKKIYNSHNLSNLEPFKYIE